MRNNNIKKICVFCGSSFGKNLLYQNTAKEVVFREMILSSLRAISRGESPRNIQDQLLANLPPKQQEKIEAAASAAG